MVDVIVQWATIFSPILAVLLAWWTSRSSTRAARHHDNYSAYKSPLGDFFLFILWRLTKYCLSLRLERWLIVLMGQGSCVALYIFMASAEARRRLFLWVKQ